MKKHILVISQYFYPEQFRINDICTEWIKRGYRVTVITGIPNYPDGKFFNGYGLFRKRQETYNGINIIRIPLIPRGHNSIMLALNYLSFIVSGFFWKVFTRIRADIVFVFEVSPMTQALPGVWYARRRKIPCFIYVQDLWPENIEIVAGISNKTVLKAIGNMVDYIYSRCTKILVTSNGFLESIAARGVSRSKIIWWPQYAESFYTPQIKKTVQEISEETFNIIFTGNIGYAQGLDILPQVATLIKNSYTNEAIRFIIVGDGRYKEEFIRSVNNCGVSDMFIFIPKQHAARIPELLAASDAAFMCLTSSPIFSLTIPAKLQSYMACGIPIIASADGETSRIVQEAEAGVCSAAGDVQGLLNAIIDLRNKTQEQLREFGINARKYYCSNFDKQDLLNKMDGYFENI